LRGVAKIAQVFSVSRSLKGMPDSFIIGGDELKEPLPVYKKDTSIGIIFTCKKIETGNRVSLV
jgi:hypothetical protein